MRQLGRQLPKAFHRYAAEVQRDGVGLGIDETLRGRFGLRENPLEAVQSPSVVGEVSHACGSARQEEKAQKTPVVYSRLARRCGRPSGATVKSLLIQLLNLLGLVPARRYHLLAAQLRDAQTDTRKLTKQVAGLENTSSVWKSKATDALKQLKVKEQELAHAVERIESIRRTADKRTGEMETMQAGLVEAERELVRAREHLMAIEVKLDILEGAANVLDARTRTAIVRQPGETGAPV